MTISSFRIAAVATVMSLAPNLGTSQARPAVSRSAKPSLVVFITIDQMRADYFARFGPQLTGGLKRLHDGGAFFANAFQDHAVTETAPGHASTMSGRYPVHTGIVLNSLGVNTRDAPLIGANDMGASPFRFQGTTLTDWMQSADPETRVFSVSRKDRGAILPIGRSKSEVYWYAPSNGTFTTSRYYADTLPAWVRDFNARHIPQSYAGKSWTPLLGASAYPEPDSVPIESNGVDYYFPHMLATDPAAAARSVIEFPWMDEMTLAFALDAAWRNGLGDGTRTDLLAVSLSTLDAVGHRYGPDSKELHDQILRLDQMIGAFLDSLETLRGKGRILVALTGDHGMSPFPDLRSTIYPNHAAQRVNLAQIWRAKRSQLLAAGLDSTAATFEEGIFTVVDASAFARAGLRPDSVAASLASDLRRVNGVMRADLVADLAKADTAKDAIARRWLHMFRPDGPQRMVVTLTPYSYPMNVTYAMHGSPHDADANVPVLFWGVGVKPGRYAETVRTVDIAPTLAAILAVKPLEPLDGHPLRAAIR